MTGFLEALTMRSVYGRTREISILELPEHEEPLRRLGFKFSWEMEHERAWTRNRRRFLEDLIDLEAYEAEVERLLREES